jgi:hypothetical protein
MQTAVVEGAMDTILDELRADNAYVVAERLAQGCTKQYWDLDLLIKALLVRILSDATRCIFFVQLLCAIHARFPDSTQTAPSDAQNPTRDFFAPKQNNFMRLFLRSCQHEFSLAFQSASSYTRSQDSLLAGRGCCLAFSMLLGNLFVRKLLSVKTLEQLLRCLLNFDRSSSPVKDNVIECACVLLQVAGPSMSESAQGKLLMAECLASLDDLKHAVGCDGRHVLHKGIRLQIQNLLDPRRRTATDPKQRETMVSAEVNADVSERCGYV